MSHSSLIRSSKFWVWWWNENHFVPWVQPQSHTSSPSVILILPAHLRPPFSCNLCFGVWTCSFISTTPWSIGGQYQSFTLRDFCSCSQRLMTAAGCTVIYSASREERPKNSRRHDLRTSTINSSTSTLPAPRSELTCVQQCLWWMSCLITKKHLYYRIKRHDLKKMSHSPTYFNISWTLSLERWSG